MTRQSNHAPITRPLSAAPITQASTDHAGYSIRAQTTNHGPITAITGESNHARGGLYRDPRAMQDPETTPHRSPQW